MSIEPSVLSQRIEKVKASTARHNPWLGSEAGRAGCLRTRRRVHTRRPTFEPCEVQTNHTTVNAVIKNISAGGAMIAGSQLRDISDSMIRLSSYISGGRCAQIVWRGTDCLGVQFI